MKNIILILSSLFLLVSCASRSHPKMLSFTPASVVIDYSDNDLHEATSLAQQFCSSTHKDAQYVRTEEKGYISTTRVAFFNCVASEKNQNSNSGNNSTMPIINNFK